MSGCGLVLDWFIYIASKTESFQTLRRVSKTKDASGSSFKALSLAEGVVGSLLSCVTVLRRSFCFLKYGTMHSIADVPVVSSQHGFTRLCYGRDLPEHLLVVLVSYKSAAAVAAPDDDESFL